jgi:hypothetical protein
MTQKKRQVMLLAPVVLMVGLALAHDRVSQICVISGDIVYCAPYDRDPPPS